MTPRGTACCPHYIELCAKLSLNKGQTAGSQWYLRRMGRVGPSFVFRMGRVGPSFVPRMGRAGPSFVPRMGPYRRTVIVPHSSAVSQGCSTICTYIHSTTHIDPSTTHIDPSTAHIDPSTAHTGPNTLVLSFSSLCLLGIHSVAYAYPKVKIVTTAVDSSVNEKYHIIPGIGTPKCGYKWMALCLE